MLTDLLILGLAAALDAAFGEPPRPLHPVVWMGKAISLLERLAPRASPPREFVYGLGMAIIVTVVAGGVAAVAVAAARGVSAVAYVIVGALLLKGVSAVRELAASAERVRASLAAGDLEGARNAVRAIVGRETAQLAPEMVASAAVESVAENSTDAFIGPWLYFALFGVPGAVIYRAINTLDSMVGHRGRYEWLGKASAMLDTAANLVPARLTGLLIVAASVVAGCDGRGAWRVMWRDHGVTASPNAGWTMSAMAGALGVRLEKVGHYALGPSVEGRPPRPDDIRSATRIMWVAATLGLLIALGMAAALRALATG
ncbi:MAG: adenosylcobinamide-phosphate synthase CbiB [Dehalococcoidia bacterium]|nr:adenosylcobinamide-phosphate synthase CbiB [Dehalococcoidia bacterium]